MGCLHEPASESDSKPSIFGVRSGDKGAAAVSLPDSVTQMDRGSDHVSARVELIGVGKNCLFTLLGCGSGRWHRDD